MVLQLPEYSKGKVILDSSAKEFTKNALAHI